jgi:acetolactate synthase-1/2/3 large subunit
MAYANMAVDAADLVIAVGMRFDDRVTGKISAFASRAKVVHIDIDPAEIGKNVRVDVPIVGDVKAVLQDLSQAVSSAENVDWVGQIDDWRREHDSTYIREGAELLPQYVVSQLYEVTEGKAVVVTGVGQHQMWTAQHYVFTEPDSFISSGGLGTMGFGLPAAMGAKVGNPDKTVWLIDGDGSLQMTVQELGTIAQDNIGVKIAVMNNGYLGMVRQWQDLFHGKRYVATPLSCPDFVKLADAYCIPALRVERREEVAPALRQAMAEPGPFLVEFMIEPEENVYPMVPPGASVSEILEAPREEASVWPRQSTP